MACYHPITAFKRSDGGPISFVECRDSREVQIPCRQCVGCRQAKREEWTIRNVCESQMHEFKHFATFTFDEAHYPPLGGLYYEGAEGLKLFLQRIRNVYGPYRYFVVGEYGDDKLRPHWHALFYGLEIPDLERVNSMRSQHSLYTSETFKRLWPFGFHSFGEVTAASARYCAAYTFAKVTGKRAEEHYQRVDRSTGEIGSVAPERAYMSLKPGIGIPWLRKYWKDIYYTEHDSVMVNGMQRPVPKAFHRAMDSQWMEDCSVPPLFMDSVEFRRFVKAQPFMADCTPERLAVREQCEVARLKFNAERFA